MIERGISSPLKGRAFAQPPAVSVWPDKRIINRTSCTESGAGSLTYHSSTGDMATLISETWIAAGKIATRFSWGKSNTGLLDSTSLM